MAWSSDNLVRRRKSVWELLFLACIIGIIVLGVRGSQQKLSQPIPLSEPAEVPERVEDDKPTLVDAPKALWCRSVVHAEDFVFSIKTSAAEIATKLPPLLESTLRCPHNLLVFSDWQETIKGQPVIDALEHIDTKIQTTHPDFDLWRRLREGGPDVLADEEMWESNKTTEKIDKWKILPMLNRTYHEYPTKKWYIFTDTSTFLFHTNLINWLNQYNVTLPHYIGLPSPSTPTLDPTLHGSTFILSAPALSALVSEYRSHPAAYHDLVSQHTHPLTALQLLITKINALEFAAYEARLKLDPYTQTPLVVNMPAWPILQPQSPATLDYRAMRDFKRLWCFPAVSYGNLSPPEIVEMHKFEAGWYVEHAGEIRDILHKDVFTNYILPRLVIRGGRADDWENFSGGGGLFMGEKKAESVSECQGTCQANEGCLQYEFAEGMCRFGDVPRMGSFKRGSQSRWLLARVQGWVEGREKCSGLDGWFTV
ncbi:unnamed protein product [Zymoseptoria tritici ST99CH_3D7]|uniref:Apple domain-containing protein n=1 Tax=Zymoseptoria tritici (strain ST99CH_3D7) TaxID=1276538 RepID=A0A1X7S596_ZYMT9|nr:unnamed protein product [Zymoseptoria tritici ST99CH_3D7]